MNDNILRSRRILIKRTEDGMLLADTRIIRFIKDRNICYNVTVLVFGADKLYEYEGNLTGAVIDNEMVVLLGRHREKENRRKRRYKLLTKGIITELCFGDREVRLNKPMKLMTVNMSSDGILVKMDSGSFEKGDCFRMVINVDNRALIFYCSVVRKQNDNMLTEEYGCRIVGTQFENENEKFTQAAN